MRARMALHHAGIQCEVREILLKEKPAEMLALSPKGTVPVLSLPDARVIDESLDIMLWALVSHDSWLSAGADKMIDLIKQNDLEFKYHLDRYKYPQRYERSTAEYLDEEHHLLAACDFLAELEHRLKASDFLFGDAVSIADVAIFPFVRQFAAVDEKRFASLPYIQVQRWLGYWLNHAAFCHIMLKRKQWHPDDDMTWLLA